MNRHQIWPLPGKGYNLWIIAALATILLMGVPVYTIVTGLFKGPGPSWPHLQQYLLPDYIGNSLLLVLGTGALTLLWGVPTAWLVSTAQFPGRRLLEWLLIMPLSIPTYIMAFTYAGIFDYTGFIQTAIRQLLGTEIQHIDILNIYGVMVIMSLALYPYVYVIARTAFLARFRSLIEASQTLGASRARSFFRVVLPVARPGLVAGIALVSMEVLNDYGAVKYFGVPTFTTGIFRSWFAYEDIQAAIYLSSLLLVAVFLILFLEKKQRGQERFHSNVTVERPLDRHKLARIPAVLATLCCAIPVLLGLLIPVLQLLLWGVSGYESAAHIDFINTVVNSFLLALAAAVSCVLVSLLLLSVSRMRKNSIYHSLMKFATMGYAIPGAVIAIGVLVPFLFLDKSTIAMVTAFGWENPGLILTGTVLGLIFAFTVRFLAVAFNPVESGFEKISQTVDEAASILQASHWKRLSQINMPLLRGALGTALLLVFVDILKELPLTLILRPFNFHTLATRSFELASDEQMAAASIPSLVIILAGIIPVYILNILITRKSRQ